MADNEHVVKMAEYMLDAIDHLNSATRSLEDARTQAGKTADPLISDGTWVELLDALFAVGEDIEIELDDLGIK